MQYKLEFSKRIKRKKVSLKINEFDVHEVYVKDFQWIAINFEDILNMGGSLFFTAYFHVKLGIWFAIFFRLDWKH
jgi:hypothetical protein